MTISGIIDTNPELFLVCETGAPRRPGAASSENSNLKTPRRPMSDDAEDDYLSEMIDARRATAEHFCAVETERAASLDTVTTHARAASAAMLAGKPDIARSEAILALRRGIQQSQTAGVERSLASLHSAAAVLRRIGQGSIATDLLAEFPPHPILAVFRATALVDDSRLDDALNVLNEAEDLDVPGAHALRGYVLLRLGKYQTALRALREAHRQDPSDIDTAMNIAATFWHMRSFKKAIRYSRYAVQLSPDRKDTTLALLNYLVQCGELEAASAELRKLHERNIDDVSELLVMQAQISLARRDVKRATSLLRSAREAAVREGAATLAAELGANLATIDYARGRLDRAATLAVVRKSLEAAPRSLQLVTMLADLVNTVSGAKEVRSWLDGVSEAAASAAGLALQSRLSYLECRFDQAMTQALAWHDNEPFNEYAAAFAIYLFGHLTEDWQKASEIGCQTLNKVGHGRVVSNMTAYALALAGHGDAGLDITERVDDDVDYVLTATKGLCYIAKGDLAKGMSLYRSAADLADVASPDGSGRTLMTLYQAMSLRRLRVEGNRPLEVQATALPSVDLPEGWENYPDYRFLQEVARRNGWDWPVLVR